MTPTECGVVCAAAPGGTPEHPPAPRAPGRGACRSRVPRRRADPPLLPVRTSRTSRTNNAELRAGTGGAPGRGSGGSRDPLDCRGPRDGHGDGRGSTILPGPTIAGARARPRRRARDGRTARVRRTPPRCEDEPQPKQLRGRARRAGPPEQLSRARRDAAGTHRNYTTRINLLYSNVQLRTAQCTSRSPIQASSPDS